MAAPTVSVTVRGGPEASTFYVARAKFLAAEIFEDAGLQVNWVNRAEPGVIVITLIHSETLDGESGPLGAARLFEGTNIRISLPKLRSLIGQRRRSELLAYVMVHEIAHILQAVDLHAPEGIMKAKWGPDEFRAIGDLTLRFTPGDVDMIHTGIKRRKNIRAGLLIPGTDSALLKRRTLP